MRRQRKTYERPFKRWDRARIAEEVRLIREYGLKNKREVWKAHGLVRRFRARARRLFTEETGREELFSKLRRLGIFKKEATLDDVLGLKVEDVLERRLQTLVYRKGLASTPQQARQLISHRHIAIGDTVVDVPGYLVTIEEEALIRYAPGSPLASPDHPLRKPPEPQKEEKKEEQKEEAPEKEKEGKEEAEKKSEGAEEVKEEGEKDGGEEGKD